jgi:hypothetical protein
MEALGLPVKYLELDGAAHDVGTWSRLNEALAWLAEQPKVRAPKRVVKDLGTLENPWCYWVRVDDLAKESDGKANSAPTARVDAKIEGQRIDVTSDGVKSLSLWLSSELVDLGEQIEVVWNGKAAFSGLAEQRLTTAVQAALERCDWRFLPEARIELR